MNRFERTLCAVCLVSALSWTPELKADQSFAESPKANALAAKASKRLPTTALWQDRGDIKSLNLFYGAGGAEHQPVGKFTFVKESKEGTSAKFDIVDSKGVTWRVKLGEEAKPETASTRLVWAAGYATDEDYYLPELQVENMAKLERGNHLVGKNGVIHGARLERKLKDQNKEGIWKWSKNPFDGTRELNGLRVMMALLNNWDLKDVNNAIYEQKQGPVYLISDLGATLGKTGNPMVRSKSNLKDYQASTFIQKIHAEHVDFHLDSRPFFLTIFHVPNYVKRTRMQGIVKHVPVSHAKWVGGILGGLSAEQIRDSFRAAGYTPAEVEGFATVVQNRIAALNKL